MNLVSKVSLLGIKHIMKQFNFISESATHKPQKEASGSPKSAYEL